VRELKTIQGRTQGQTRSRWPFNRTQPVLLHQWHQEDSLTKIVSWTKIKNRLISRVERIHISEGRVRVVIFNTKSRIMIEKKLIYINKLKIILFNLFVTELNSVIAYAWKITQCIDWKSFPICIYLGYYASNEISCVMWKTKHSLNTHLCMCVIPTSLYRSEVKRQVAGQW